MKNCLGRMAAGIIKIDMGMKKFDPKNLPNEDAAKKAEASLGVSNIDFAVTIDCRATTDEFKKVMSENMDEDDKISKEEFESNFFYRFEDEDEDEDSFYYVAVVDNLLLITARETTMKDIIGQIIQPDKKNTLSKNPKFIDIEEKMLGYDFISYGRLDYAYEMLIANDDTYIFKKLKNNPKFKPFINHKAIKEDIHLDAFDFVYGGAKITDEGAYLDYGFSVKSKEGVAGLFTYDRNIPAFPEYAFEDFTSLTVSSYDTGKSFSYLDKIISKVSPIGMTALKTQGDGLYESIIDNLADNLEPYYVRLGGHIDKERAEKHSSSTSHIFKLKNRERIQKLMEKLQGVVRPIETIDFMGESVYKIGIVYIAAVNQFLVITQTREDAMWKHIISQIKSPGKNLLDNKVLADMWNTLEDGEVSMGYYDLSQMIRDAHFASSDSEKVGVKINGIKVNESDKGKKPKNSKVPDTTGLNYSIVSKFYQNKNFWSLKAKLKDYSPHQK